jgi:catechol 2,3-dioxygenase-like lactoylglutathione lyase family enzyme
MTFFAWPGAYRGRIGPPQVSVTAFSIPAGAIEFWTQRLKERSVAVQAGIDRLGERVLAFTDPDGMRLELIGAAGATARPWEAGPVPVEHAIRGFHGVTISEEGYENTAKLLTDVMGFKAAGSEQNRFRYRAGSGDGSASTVDLLCVPDAHHGKLGAGVVHHIAFRTPNDARQEAWRKELARLGFNVSPVMDRTYFHSIYYREPGGVLFEIATDNPGFTVDESAEQLGTRLALPPWLEPQRAEIERIVPPVKLPSGRKGA